MGRTAKKCKQCGREIYFDGICISCRAENEKNRILALTLRMPPILWLMRCLGC